MNRTLSGRVIFALGLFIVFQQSRTLGQVFMGLLSIAVKSVPSLGFAKVFDSLRLRFLVDESYARPP